MQSLVSVHRSALAYHMPIPRQPPMHRISVRIVHVSSRTATYPTSARTQTLPCHPPRTSASGRRLVHPPPQSISTGFCLPRLTSKYVHISSNATIDARTLSCRPLVRHARNRVRRSVANTLFCLTRLPWVRSRLLRTRSLIDSFHQRASSPPDLSVHQRIDDLLPLDACGASCICTAACRANVRLS